MFSATFTGLSVLWDREFGFLKEIMVAPVSRLAIILEGLLVGPLLQSSRARSS
jgi:ABC-type multidrug transport system permease subunit